MQILKPQSAEEMAELLRSHASAGRSIRLGGSFTKDAMAGPVAEADATISTTALTRVIQYEPNDLTISVGAGVRFAELARLLAENRQMVPLDPPLFEEATVGGVVAANCSGPRRRLYGTARDQVIGMTFATLEGKLIQSGGMVVKNVAGLDMGKLMIGSFGTLAAITSVNFKLNPIPPQRRTFVLSFDGLEDALAARNSILEGVLQPVAIDLLNPPAAVRVGLEGYSLLLEVAGNRAVIGRYTRELASAKVLEDNHADRMWAAIREFSPAFLREYPNGAVVRIPATIQDVRRRLERHTVPVVVRAGNGVCYAHYERMESASPEGRSVIEWAAPEQKKTLPLWPNPGNDFAIMERIKEMFDPARVLNRGRLYGRI